MVEGMPLRACQSRTFDNGTDVQHALSACTRRFGIQTWFCDTHSPWQKGGIENAIGRLRHQLPRKTDLNALPAPASLASWNATTTTPESASASKPRRGILEHAVALQT